MVKQSILEENLLLEDLRHELKKTLIAKGWTNKSLAVEFGKFKRGTPWDVREIGKAINLTNKQPRLVSLAYELREFMSKFPEKNRHNQNPISNQK